MGWSFQWGNLRPCCSVETERQNVGLIRIVEVLQHGCSPPPNLIRKRHDLDDLGYPVFSVHIAWDHHCFNPQKPQKSTNFELFFGLKPTQSWGWNRNIFAENRDFRKPTLIRETLCGLPKPFLWVGDCASFTRMPQEASNAATEPGFSQMTITLP